MNKLPVILILVLSVSVAWGVSGYDTTLIPEPPLLREGFVLRGVDGTLSGPDCNDAWFFELAADVNDSRDVLEAGTKVQILPSSTLEEMIADGRSRSEMTFRLWNGRVTRYKGRNFIFPSFFLPIQPEKEPEQKTPETTEPAGPDKTVGTPAGKEPGSVHAARDPNDILTIPSDILEKLQATRKIMAARKRPIADSNNSPAVGANPSEKSRKKRYQGSLDSVFVNRTGFLVRRDDGSFIFELDALGRNVQRRYLHLLPCETLELAERMVSVGFEPVRLRISGILTRFQNTEYLLLHKATPTYSHGNFGK